LVFRLLSSLRVRGALGGDAAAACRRGSLGWVACWRRCGACCAHAERSATRWLYLQLAFNLAKIEFEVVPNELLPSIFEVEENVFADVLLGRLRLACILVKHNQVKARPLSGANRLGSLTKNLVNFQLRNALTLSDCWALIVFEDAEAS